MRRSITVITAALLAAAPIAAQTVPAAAPTDRIVDQGTNHSEVMRIAQYLTDVIGSRLTNSPGMRKAEDWTQAKFREWGLANVHKEGFDFGRGWSNERLSVRMVAPRPLQLVAAPLAWTPGTSGPVRGEVVLAPMADPSAFAALKGKLRGKIVLLTEPKEIKDALQPPFKRWTDAELAERNYYDLPNSEPASGNYAARFAFAAKRDAFLKEEGALGYATMSSRNGKLVHGQNSQFQVGQSGLLPGIEIAAEDYRRLARLAKMGAKPELEIDAASRFDDSDTKAYNILADIPGTDAKAGYVMAGAHLDSWAMGDGAADNAAGSAMVMEAARIIKASGIRPKRTIRFALWAGEEQGLLGSMAYVENHIARRPVDPSATGIVRYLTWSDAFPITPGPDHAKLAAYFNLDNGSGKIRGIYAQGNTAAMPIFEQWFAPFRAMGATSVSARRTDSTDHVFFDAVGIPAFQFIQDPLDYGSMVHHTDVDTFDHLKADDLRQGAIILAAFLVNAANSDQPLPRAPLATAPTPADRFYPFPSEAAH
ncbi:M20/M25/M40 family metallo-hydrolase [Sphingomonas sp. HT-1]|uniref:M20/M25/M40 family metallo-hydrolase n=1 Tax=unclassified Sphingomonas TaxID=196159 RepID=UPI0002DC1044|nr:MULTISPECIES: M20/M25/M40 family metallo-hydrolase [unclassified Sphingomonas]KTF67345.1 peptidase M28 [Sphingomonas sp. WG]